MIKPETAKKLTQESLSNRAKAQLHLADFLIAEAAASGEGEIHVSFLDYEAQSQLKDLGYKIKESSSSYSVTVSW